MKINININQTPGYVHALGFIDQARFLRHQLRRLGLDPSITKRRFRRDAINIVLGAHAAPDEQLIKDIAQHQGVIFNLEQLGDGGASLPELYVEMLKALPLIDYDQRNLEFLGRTSGDQCAVLRLGFAPYLATHSPIPIEERSIDILFIGSINERRQRMFKEIEQSGFQISVLDKPLYCEERDAFIRQSKCVLNCHYYESARLEQARITHALSLGTPVIAERLAHTEPGILEPCVSWFPSDQAGAWFATHFGQKPWLDSVAQQLSTFQETDVIEDYQELQAQLAKWFPHMLSEPVSIPWIPKALHIGSGRDYRPGFLNIDILERAQPDLLLNLSEHQTFPMEVSGQFGGTILLAPNQFDLIVASNVLEHIPDLTTFMTNLLLLLEEEGRLWIEVPYEKSLAAWQDPTHVRAMNENSWLYYTDWFWYLNWFEYRFEVIETSWLNDQHTPCEQPAATFMRCLLKKISTSPSERTLARTIRADFGGIPDDRGFSAATS